MDHQNTEMDQQNTENKGKVLFEIKPTPAWLGFFTGLELVVSLWFLKKNVESIVNIFSRLEHY